MIATIIIAIISILWLIPVIVAIIILSPLILTSIIIDTIKNLINKCCNKKNVMIEYRQQKER